MRTAESFGKLENTEFWYELEPRQRGENAKRPGIYNAMLHRRCGWSTAANGIIQFQLPQLPSMSGDNDIRQHIEIIERFCCQLLTWLKKFAAEVWEYWQTDRYRRGIETSKC